MNRNLSNGKIVTSKTRIISFRNYQGETQSKCSELSAAMLFVSEEDIRRS